MLPGVPVRLKDNQVFVIRAPHGGRSPEERAQRASRALAAAVEDPRATELRVVRHGAVAVIYAGPTPLVQLGEEDAELAGDTSLDVHAGAVAAQIRAALDSERWRARVSKNVFSFSLVVFLGLIAVYLIRKTGALSDRIRAWLDENGERELGLRVRDVEIVHPATLRSSALVGLEIAKWLSQIGIIYVWLVASLSLFEATRGYTQRLTGLVVTPFSELMERLARALPLLIVALIAAFAVFVLVRFIGLFFASVARRETALTWLPPELAAPTSALLRFSIVVGALVFAAPVVTGGADGAFARTGVVILGALGLSSTPLLASGLVGSIVLFGRRLRVGEYAEFDGQLGRISSIGLLETHLRLFDDTELRVPHLLLLVRPLRGLGAHPRLSVDLVVSAEVSTNNVRRVFDEAARSVGRNVRAELLGLSADGISYRVTVTCDSLAQRSDLLSALLDALTDAQIPLGRAPGSVRALTRSQTEHA